MASVVITDNLDGTVTADITATGPWTLYAARWQGFEGATAWTAVDTGTGDTTLPAASPPNGPGCYFWSVDEGGAMSAPVYGVVQMFTDVPWQRAVSQIALGIQALALSGMPQTSIFQRIIPISIKGDPLPNIVVSPYPSEAQISKTNARDVIGYPVTVAFYDGADGKLTKELGRWLNWRYRVAKLLIEARIESSPHGIYRVLWKPDLPASVSALKNDMMIGAMVFEAHSLEPRGAT